jgi:hypothetical protein
VSLPILHTMPRVGRDIDLCLGFVERQPWGKRGDRELDIHRGIAEARAHPEMCRREVYRPLSGIWLRRRRVSQFVIVYAYLPSPDPTLRSVVSIRAVKHARVANVFQGVKEPPTKPWRGEVA